MLFCLATVSSRCSGPSHQLIARFVCGAALVFDGFMFLIGGERKPPGVAIYPSKLYVLHCLPRVHNFLGPGSLWKGNGRCRYMTEEDGRNTLLLMRKMCVCVRLPCIMGCFFVCMRLHNWVFLYLVYILQLHMSMYTYACYLQNFFCFDCNFDGCPLHTTFRMPVYILEAGICKYAMFTT